MEDKVLFSLSYLKTHNLQLVQGERCGMHQPEACFWIHLLLPLVNQALADGAELPARTRAELKIDDEASQLFCHDGTAHPATQGCPNAENLLLPQHV